MEDSDPLPLGSRRRDSFAVWSKRMTDKVLLPLIVLGIATVTAGAVANWVSTQRLTDQVAIHEARINTLQVEISSAKAAMVTQAQLLETLKRVEQQMEITILRAQRQGQ